MASVLGQRLKVIPGYLFETAPAVAAAAAMGAGPAPEVAP